MSVLIDSLLYAWDRNLSYAQRLLNDIPAEKMCHQPAPGMTHPAWVLCHLNIYHPVLVAVVSEKSFVDPKDHIYGFKSEAVADASKYPAKTELVDSFTRGHNEVGAALRAMKAGLLESPPPLPRWQKIKNIGVLITDLMLVHESTHLGQISAWRRVQGMARV